MAKAATGKTYFNYLYICCYSFFNHEKTCFIRYIQHIIKLLTTQKNSND